MTYDEARARLLNHAGLPRSGACVGLEEGFTYLLSRSTDGDVLTKLRVAFEDIINCVQAVNCELNGPVPSKIRYGKKDKVDRRLAVAVAEIVSKAWESCFKWHMRQVPEESVQQLVQLTWAISDAWLAVLHGDFDSIRAEIENEAQSRRARAQW